MFNLKFDIGLSDLMLIMGILIIAAGIYLINKPAAVVFVGAALIVLAFLLSPRPPKSDEGR